MNNHARSDGHIPEVPEADRLVEVVQLLGSQVSRRGFLGFLAKGGVIVTGAATGLFSFAGVLGTDVRDALACYDCNRSDGGCACTSGWFSVCYNADGGHPCFVDAFGGCVMAICYGGHHTWSCPDDCAPCNCDVAC